MECEYILGCAFIENANRLEPFTVWMIKKSYCENNKYECARYRMKLSFPEKDIPDELWPNSDEGDVSNVVGDNS
jgi:hypothetical protein